MGPGRIGPGRIGSDLAGANRNRRSPVGDGLRRLLRRAVVGRIRPRARLRQGFHRRAVCDQPVVAGLAVTLTIVRDGTKQDVAVALTAKPATTG